MLVAFAAARPLAASTDQRHDGEQSTLTCQPVWEASVRRGVLEQLGRADASISDLANRFDMTLTGMK